MRLNTLQVGIIPNNKMAGADWFSSLRKCYQNLSLRIPESTSTARSFGFNKTAMNEFFQNLVDLYRKYNFTAERIFNYDESGISNVLTTPPIFVEKVKNNLAK